MPAFLIATMKKSVLIIKLGYAETLVHEDGFIPSLGDVFRHTVLLHHYANDCVTWLTSESAVPLLKGNPFIDKILIYRENIAEELSLQRFDEVLCLEKAPTLCALSKSIDASRHLGFGWTRNGTNAHPGAESALDIANGKDHFLPIQALLYQMVGDYWHGENYILGYSPKPRDNYDVGFNIKVGSKWPTKEWPMSHWKELEKMCVNHGLKVKWQEGHNNIEDYMDWINAGRLIVTCDSLGMHLGLAMKKKVIALFGPTPSEDIYMYGRGVILSAEWACGKAPCMNPTCSQNNECMGEISPKIVARTIINLINGLNGKTEGTQVKLQAA